MKSLLLFFCEEFQLEVDAGQPSGKSVLLLHNGQPARLYDHTGQLQHFFVARVTDPEALDDSSLAELVALAETGYWLAVVDSRDQVRGIIEPDRAADIPATARARKKPNEFGGFSIFLPGSGGGEVQIPFDCYQCLKHPEAGLRARFQAGSPVPKCPYGDEMTKVGAPSSAQSSSPNAPAQSPGL